MYVYICSITSTASTDEKEAQEILKLPPNTYTYYLLATHTLILVPISTHYYLLIIPMGLFKKTIENSL